MKKIYLVPHTHFDAEVFLTREEYLEWGFSNVLEALRMLRVYPEFRFTIDQVCYVEPFLQRYPECRKEFLGLIKEGRLYFAGGMYAMADVNMPLGESLARQFLRGVNYCREVLGADVLVAWTIDSFGHSPQTPQLFRQAGFKYAGFQRVGGFAPSDFIWEAPDGSEVLCHHMPLSYGFPDHNKYEDFEEEVFCRLEIFEEYAATDNIFMAYGADLSAPHPQIIEQVKTFNKTYPEYKIVFATAIDYFLALEKNRDLLERKKIDLNPVFQGCYSSRIENKLGNRRLERELLTTETVAACSGSEFNADDLQRAWDRVLFNQFHDDICGCVVDKVFKLIQERYAASEETALEIKRAALDKLGESADTRGEGIPLLVFNPLGWQRKEVVTAKVSVLEPDGVKGFEVRNSQGEALLSSVIKSDCYNGGGYKEVTIRFVAQLPSMGYEVFRIVPLSVAPKRVRTSYRYGFLEVKELAIGNEFFDLKMDYITGVIRSLKLKESGEELIDMDRPWGTMITKEPDNGDFWELDSSLRGGLVPLNKSRKVLEIPGARYTKDAGAICGFSRDEVRSSLYIKQNIDANVMEYNISIYEGINRIEVEGTITNQEKDVLYRAAIPLNIVGTTVRGIPFGYCETPEGEYPAVDFMDVSDGQKGLTVLNTGNVGNCYLDNVYTLALLKATTYKNYGGGGFSETEKADGGYEIGKRIPFKYALMPHDGEFAPAESAKAAREFNVASEVWKCSVHDGSLPKRFSFVSCDCPTVLITCLKPDADGYVLRLYEAGGVSYDDVTVTVNLDLSGAVEVDFTEKPVSGEKIVLVDQKLQFAIQKNKVKTFRLFRQ